MNGASPPAAVSQSVIRSVLKYDAMSQKDWRIKSDRIRIDIRAIFTFNDKIKISTYTFY
jgi:hypothetical protein